MSEEFKIDELAERRSTQAGDCRLWSPRDALVAAIKDIDAGVMDPSMLVISYRENDKEDPNIVYYRYLVAGCTSMEHAGLLAVQLARVSAQ